MAPASSRGTGTHADLCDALPSLLLLGIALEHALRFGHAVDSGKVTGLNIVGSAMALCYATTLPAAA